MVKVDVVSGFLGAGKTTLIKKMLKAYSDQKVVLIENEFGEIGIDGDLVKRDGFDVFEITAGCICCIMKNDFVKVFEKILDEFKPDRIIIEPTGISILSEIINVLNKPDFQGKCTINSLITIVDGINYLEHRDIFGEFFEDQITNAGTLIISKSQFVDEQKMKEITISLKELNSKAPIITSNWSEMPKEDIRALFNMDLDIDFQDLFYAKYKPCSDNQFDTIGIKTLKKYTEVTLREVLEKLKSSEYGRVIRGKGFVKGIDGDLEFSLAGEEYEIYPSKNASTGKLCIIGQDLKVKEIKELFKSKVGRLLKW